MVHPDVRLADKERSGSSLQSFHCTEKRGSSEKPVFILPVHLNLEGWGMCVWGGGVHTLQRCACMCRSAPGSRRRPVLLIRCIVKSVASGDVAAPGRSPQMRGPAPAAAFSVAGGERLLLRETGCFNSVKGNPDGSLNPSGASCLFVLLLTAVQTRQTGQTVPRETRRLRFHPARGCYETLGVFSRRGSGWTC